MVSGGGFVVTDCSQQVVFRADGCGIHGIKDQLILRDGDGDALLLMRRKVQIFKSSFKRRCSHLAEAIVIQIKIMN